MGRLHSIRSAAGSVYAELIDSNLCEQGGYVAMPELAWGQQDRASPGSNFKRIHIVLRRHLPLKVLLLPPAAPVADMKCTRGRDQPGLMGT